MQLRSIPCGTEVNELKTVRHELAFNLTKATDRVALMYQTKTSYDRKTSKLKAKITTIRTGYFGFHSQVDAMQFCEAVNTKYSAFCEVRTPQRLNGYAFEVKVKSFEGIEKFTWEMALRQDAKNSMTGVAVEIRSPDYYEDRAESMVYEVKTVTVQVPTHLLPKKDAINSAIASAYPGWTRYELTDSDREEIEAQAYYDLMGDYRY